MTTTQELKELNLKNIAEFRATHGRISMFGDIPMLLLHTIGARSGQERVNPMTYQRDGDRFLVFASNAGADRHPDWYWNLRAQPDATIEVGDETFAVHATELTGAERDEKYRIQVASLPVFADYQARAPRTIPVVALNPVKEPGDQVTGKISTWGEGRLTDYPPGALEVGTAVDAMAGQAADDTSFQAGAGMPSAPRALPAHGDPWQAGR